MELRDAAALPGTPVVAEARIDLKGRQVPVPFAISVDRDKLSAGKRFVVRGAIVTGGRPRWASQDIAIDSAAPKADVGLVRLLPVQIEPFRSELMCDTERISASFDRDAVRVTVGGQTYEMRQVKSASGVKYEVAGDPATSFWNKGRSGTLVVKGRTYPECTLAKPELEQRKPR